MDFASQTEVLRSMRRAGDRSVLAAIGFALLLAGCSSSAVVDQLPASIGGEPAGAPARPAGNAYTYPAVHDMPPPRPTTTLTEEQQIKMEKDLSAMRDKQEVRDGAAKKTGQPGKKKPEAANTGQAQGTQNGSQDGAKTNP
jgi:hypothetical protein